MAEQSLNETAVALILFQESLVFLAQAVALLCLHGDFAFKLSNIL